MVSSGGEISIKTVREIIENLHKNDDMTFHKALGNNVEILPSDWLRVYKGGDCIFNELIYSCDWKDIDSVPDNILDMSIDMFSTWMIGGDLSCDCIILDDKYREEYQVDKEKEKLFV